MCANRHYIFICGGYIPVPLHYQSSTTYNDYTLNHHSTALGNRNCRGAHRYLGPFRAKRRLFPCGFR